MEPADRIFRHTCARCELPALTFDEQDRALCARHATIFIAAPWIEYDADAYDDWSAIPASVEASVPRS